jgi:hypothetical protein
MYPVSSGDGQYFPVDEFIPAFSLALKRKVLFWADVSL